MDDGASIMSDTATLVERPDPPTATILKPNHSTRASRLSHDTSQGRYSILEYMELTFSIMVMCNNMKAPLVVAIDEDFDTLLGDVQRTFCSSSLYSTTRLKELKISLAVWEFGGTPSLNSGNIVAMLRLLKSRNGRDMIIAK